MIRRLTAALATLLLVGGFGFVAAGPAQARAVIPHHGVYNGTDQTGRHVSFTFGGAHGNQMTHFTVGHQVIGGAHVSHGAWHETCHGGMCTKGHWTSDNQVTGAWRVGGGHWTTFTAHFNPPNHPYTGTYMGRDHRGLSTSFSYGNHHVVHFKLDHNVIGGAAVHNRHFSACHHNVCFKGHWQTDHEVVGSWRYVNSHDWHGWEAYAYSA